MAAWCRLASVLALTLCGLAARAQAEAPPQTWVDKDTGHRIWRLTPEPNSAGLYFNYTAFTSDGKWMVYNAPDGIHGLDMGSKQTKLVVPSEGGRGGARTIAVGRKSHVVFYLKEDQATRLSSIWSADFDTNATKKLVDLPAGYHVDSINADDTLAAGTYEEKPRPDAAYPQGAQPGGPMNQPRNKGEMMERRLKARIPLVLFAIDLRSGKVKTLLRSTDWINHLLFSPTDPTLLMYCHEGPWQKVDRIWTIRTDGRQNTNIHKRTMAMEIAGHEFWGQDGTTVWYDWQYPKGQTFYVAGRNLATGQRTAYHLERNDWSIHFNVSSDGKLFAGDGGDVGQVAKAPDGEWVVLLKPRSLVGDGALNDKDYWQAGQFDPERLVNMKWHDYHLEPNVRFSPDNGMVIFRTNMFGDTYVLGVEVAKAAAGATDVMSTPELAQRFNPKAPVSINIVPNGVPRR